MIFITSAFQSATNDSVENKLELLRMVLPVNATVLLAVISLAFVIYQLDRYKDFKSFNYKILSYSAVLGLVIGVVTPLVLIQKTALAYTSIENILYVVSILSPLIVAVISAVYLWLHLSSLKTPNMINRFSYTSEPKDRASKQSPLAAQVQAICKWHGLVMQEWDSANLSGLVKRDDLLLRLASTAILENDTSTFKLIIKHYAKLLLANTSHEVAEFYEDDLSEIEEQLIYAKKDKLYEYMIDELSLAWLSNKESLESMSDELGNIYAGLIYKYINLGENFNVIQKSMGLLVNFHFLVITSDGGKKDWLNTRHALEAYLRNSIVKIAQKKQDYNLWLMHEKIRYLANHGGEVKKASLMSEYMKYMYITGIAGRAYNLHCGASNCSKTLYQHAVEDLEELYGWRVKLSNKQQEIFDRNYKDALEKLIGYQITIDNKNGKYEINKKHPKQAHSVTLGPSKSTSDSKLIDYSSLTAEQFEMFIFSHGRLF